MPAPRSRSHRLLALALAVSLPASVARAAAPPDVTVHALAAAPRLETPANGNASGDPRAAKLAAFVQRARASAAARPAAGRGAAGRGEREAEAALARLRARAAGEIEVKMDAGRRTPRMLRGKLQHATSAAPGRTRAERTARAFLRDQRALLRLADPDLELELAREESDELGRTHLRFHQRHHGVPVEPAELVVHLDPRGDVDVVNGSWAPTPELATAPKLTAEDATALARLLVDDALEAPIPAPELVVWAPGDRPARLAWSLFVPVSLTRKWRVVVDATSGDLLTSWNTVMDADVVGSGVDLLGQTRTIHVWQENGTNYLVDASKAMFDPSSDPPEPNASRGVITVVDAQNQPPTNHPDSIPPLYHIHSVAAGGPAATWVPDGVSALVNLSAVYDYYLAAHGRNSLDGEGGSLLAVVRLGLDYHNAYYSSTDNLMAFGDADRYAAAVDAVAHELTHGVTFHSAGLIYRGESGALNEAMSDVFGEMVEASVNGAPDWRIGTGLVEPLRDFADPGSLLWDGMPYPSNYAQYRDTGDYDAGGVHYNSSIINHGFYQLAVGLAGHGIGTTDAARIFYRALTVYLTASSRFVDARLACEQAAVDLFGAASNQVLRVRQAFDAVGIFDGSSTPPPEPYPGTEGDDSTLFLRWDVAQETYFLYRLETALDGATPHLLALYEVAPARPAVTGDGSLAWFVDSLHDVCAIATDGSQPEESCAGLYDQIASVAVAPRGDSYGFVLRDPVSGERTNQITVIDLSVDPPGVRTYELGAPATTPSGSISLATVEYADTMDFTADGKLVVYDALNRLDLASGGTVDVWSVYALDLDTGTVFAIVPPRPDVDVGFPSLAQRSDNYLVFDAFDRTTATGSVIAANLDSGERTVVASGLGGYGVPSYTGDDEHVVYSDSAATDTGFSLWSQTVIGRMGPQGQPVPWTADADYSTVYRRGAFVPEPSADLLAAAVAGGLAALARRRTRGIPARTARAR